MITDLVKIRRLAESKQAENVEFRRQLSAHHYPVEPFQILASQIQEQMDCTACANCCRYTVVSVSQAEIETIARYLGMETGEATRQYTEPDPAASTARTLINKNDACTFLDGNLCMIYEARPAACRNFPHVAPHSHSLGARFSSLCRNAWFCPIIYNALESYKKRMGFHPSHT